MIGQKQVKIMQGNRIRHKMEKKKNKLQFFQNIGKKNKDVEMIIMNSHTLNLNNKASTSEI